MIRIPIGFFGMAFLVAAMTLATVEGLPALLDRLAWLICLFSLGVLVGYASEWLCGRMAAR